MKKYLMLATVLFFTLALNAQNVSDTAQIRIAAFNYMQGWYEGNAERMTKALHPDLVKRAVQTLDTTSKRQIIRTSTADMMIRFTEAGGGKKLSGAKEKLDYTLLDANSLLAVVKLVSLDFVDYLQLCKINGEWKIINVLWVPMETLMKSAK
jgi:hypothetical protein